MSVCFSGRFRLALSAFFTLVLTFSLEAQHLSLKGSITDLQGNGVEAATLQLLRSQDSSLVKVELSDVNGQYEFANLSAGAYKIGVSALGFSPQLSAAIALSENAFVVPAIRLQPSAATGLKEVTIAAQRPFIERKPDRTVLNVESSILATGSTALEVLERAPGVIVNSNDAISLRGRAGVVVMIDGKITPLSGADLSNFLRAMPSSSIDRIELITNPGAQYDAAGNAGIIDIRLKKDKNLGTNGSFSLNYGQGVYPKAGSGVTLNHRTSKLNLFGSYNYNFRKGMNDLRLYRTFFDKGVRSGAYLQRNYLVIPRHAHALRTGIDYFPNKKTTVGLVLSGNFMHFNSVAQNTSSVEGAEAGKVESFFGTSNNSRDQWPSYAFNGNFKQLLGETGSGHEWSADLDFARFGNDTEQLFRTKYQKTDGSELRPDYLLQGYLRGDLSIYSFKADYVRPLPGKVKLESGIKSSWVEADNELRFYDQSTAGVSLYDSNISNHFIYRENINAGYLNASGAWKKFSAQAGLRVENTRAEGVQLVNGESFDRNYTNLFPSIFLNYTFSAQYELNLNLSRRLDRPTYRQLNPFKSYLDPSTYSAGNAWLNPQFTWAAEFTQRFGQNLNLALAASRTTDNITQVIAPVSGLERVTVQTDSNLATVTYFSAVVSYNFKIAAWWNTVNNLNLWQGKYSGNLANTSLSDGNLVAHFFTTHNFSFKNNWSSELNFNYKTREIYGFMHLNPMWALGVGIQKQVLKNRGTLKLAATDIFWQNLPSATIYFNDYVETFEVFRETRTVTLSLNYRFGKNSVPQSRRRQGGAEEEKRRASGGQG